MANICLGTSADLEFTRGNGLPRFRDENRYINAIRFVYSGNTTTPKHFKTTFFAMYRREAEVSLRSYVLIDPLASEQQHSYCTGWKVNNGSHGLTGDASSIFEENSHGWGIPGTGCGGYFTLFFKEPIDMSGITKIRWKYDMGDECGSRSVTFRSVNTGPSISGTYVLADPENDWAKLSGIQEATNYKKVGYIQKFGENRICQNQAKKGNRRPISSKMPLSLYNFVDDETGEEPLFLKTNSLADQIPSCCRDYDNTIMTFGDGIDRHSVGGVSVQYFEEGGRLCFDDILMDGLSNPYGVKIEIDGETVYGKIKATGQFKNNEVVYLSPSGDYYKGKLISKTGFDNELKLVGKCEEVVVIDTGDPQPIIKLPMTNLDFINKTWNDATTPAINGSMGGNVKFQDNRCGPGARFRGDGGYITFPTMPSKPQTFTLDMMFEINGQTDYYDESNLIKYDNIDFAKSGIYNKREKWNGFSPDKKQWNKLLKSEENEHLNDNNEFVYNKNVDINDYPTMQVVGNATKTNPGGDYRGFNYQIVFAFKTPISIKKGSRIHFNFLPRNVYWGYNQGGPRNAETNKINMYATTLPNLENLGTKKNEWAGCVCCPFTSFIFNEKLGYAEATKDIDNITYISSGPVTIYGGCNGRYTWTAGLQALSILPPENLNSQYLAFQQNTTIKYPPGYYLKYNPTSSGGGSLEMGVQYPNGSFYNCETREDSVLMNSITHVHAVFNETKMQLYIDGTEIVNAEKPRGIDYHPSHKLHLGRARATGVESDRYLNGTIYEFDYYDAPLEADYIEKIFFNKKCAPPDPTPTPTPTKTPTPTPTPTPVLETDCGEHEDDRTWTILNSNFTGYGSNCITEAVWENMQSNAWKINILPGDCGEVICCTDDMNSYEVGPNKNTIVDGENQITVGRQLYDGLLCVDSGRGDIEQLVINEVTLFVSETRPIGTIIFTGHVNSDPTIYLSIMDSAHAEDNGYPNYNGVCMRGTIVNGECRLKEFNG